jgi:hypothetical protein
MATARTLSRTRIMSGPVNNTTENLESVADAAQDDDTLRVSLLTGNFLFGTLNVAFEYDVIAPTVSVLTLSSTSDDISIPAGATSATFVSGPITRTVATDATTVNLLTTGGTVVQNFDLYRGDKLSDAIVSFAASVARIGVATGHSGTNQYLSGKVFFPRDAAMPTYAECAGDNITGVYSVENYGAATAATDCDTLRVSTLGTSTQGGSVHIVWRYDTGLASYSTHALSGASTSITIPAGAERVYFRTGQVTMSVSTASLNAKLQSSAVDTLMSGVTHTAFDRVYANTSTAEPRIENVNGTGAEKAIGGELIAPRSATVQTISRTQGHLPTTVLFYRELSADVAQDDDTLVFSASSGTISGTLQMWAF